MSYRAGGLSASGLFVAALTAGLVRHERRLVRDVIVHLAETERLLRECAVQSTDALGVPCLPRSLPFVVVKRTNPRFLGTYGHWWIEVDGAESYGWWASRCPIRAWDLFIGTPGTLNGVGGTCTGGTPTRDPHHGDDADHSFHPTLISPKTDDEVRADIRSFAQSFSGRWRYSLDSRLSGCHVFQLRLFSAVGLVEEGRFLYTRGPGCPFYYPWRRLGGHVAGTLLPGRRITPGQDARARLSSTISASL